MRINFWSCIRINLVIQYFPPTKGCCRQNNTCALFSLLQSFFQLPYKNWWQTICLHLFGPISSSVSKRLHTQLEPSRHLIGHRIFSFQQGLCLFVFMYFVFVQHCFVCRPSIVSEEAGIEPWIVVTLALAVRRSYHSTRSHPPLD